MADLSFNLISLSMVLLIVCAQCQRIEEEDAASSLIPEERDQLAAILDRLTSLDERLGRINQRLNSLEDHVTEVQSSVNTLMTQNLSVLCTALPDVTPSKTPPIDDVFLSSTTEKPAIPFRISRVEKSETEEEFKVKVVYDGNKKPITVMRHNSLIREEVEQALQGVAEFSIPKGPGDGTYAVLYFALPDQYLILRLSLLHNQAPNSLTIPPVHFNVLQGNDIQVRPGEDVKMNFTLDVGVNNNYDNVNDSNSNNSISSSSSSSVDDLSIQTRVLIRSAFEDNVVERYSDFTQDFNPTPAPPVRVDIVDEEISKNHLSGQAVVNSSRDNLEGIVELTYRLRLHCSSSPYCLVEDVRDVYRVRFYQNDHEAPFPEGFLGFVHEDFIVDDSHVFCEVDEAVCVLTCRAFGQPLTAITISRLSSPLGENVYLSQVNLTYGEWGVSRVFLTNFSFQDSGEEFLCTAKTARREIRKRITLNVVRKARIDMDRSRVVLYENGSALFVCVAEGIPSPDVKLEDEPINDQPNVIPEVHVTHPSQSETRAELFISDPQLLSNVYGFYCFASTVRNYIFSRDDSFFLPYQI